MFEEEMKSSLRLVRQRRRKCVKVLVEPLPPARINVENVEPTPRASREAD